MTWHRGSFSPCGCTVLTSEVTSGCRVAEWIPYAWKHWLIVFAVSMNESIVGSETTTWTDARVFSWLSCQMCNSWTERTPGTYFCKLRSSSPGDQSLPSRDRVARPSYWRPSVHSPIGSLPFSVLLTHKLSPVLKSPEFGDLLSGIEERKIITAIPILTPGSA